jgi:hypothetical protein
MLELSVVERRSLKSLETVIDKGLSHFIEVGTALKEISENKLYRENYRTFESYVSKRFEIQKTHAYQLIAAVEVKEDLSAIADKIELPKNEAQYRELAKLPDDAVSEVWTSVVETCEEQGEFVTAKRVKDAVDVFRGEIVEPEPEPEQAADPDAGKLLLRRTIKTVEAIYKAINEIGEHDQNFHRNKEEKLIKMLNSLLDLLND